MRWPGWATVLAIKPESGGEMTTNKSLWRVLLEFAGSVAMVVVPLLVAARLPLGWGLLVEAALIACVPLLAWHKSFRWAQRLTEWASWAMFGLGWSVWRAFPTWWGAWAGVVVALVGADAVQAMDRRFHLTYPRGGKPGAGLPDAFYAALRTPEGQTIRVFSEGEAFHAYGPITRHLLFPDGVLLGGVGLTGRFSRDGRYFAVVVPRAREDDGLLVLDRVDRTVRLDVDSEPFWQLPEFAPGAMEPSRALRRGRPSPWWAAFLRQFAPQALEPFQDLWLDPSAWNWALDRWRTTQAYPSPDGGHRMVTQPVLPASFAALADPVDRLTQARHELALDNVPSGYLTQRPSSGAWSGDGTVFACRATPPDMLDDPAQASKAWRRFVCWSAACGWQQAPDVEDFAPEDVPRETANAPILEGDALQLDTLLDTPVLNHGRYGTWITSRREILEVPAGVEADGVAQPRRLHRRRVRLTVPLPWLETPRATTGQRVISSSPDDAAEAVFERDHVNAAGLSAWRCRIGDWVLPGLWLLDHRWMDAGAGLALCRFAEDLPLADQVVLALPESRALMRSAPLLVAGLHDAYQDEVAAIVLAGRIDRHLDGEGHDLGRGAEGNPLGTLLAPFDVPAPAPDAAVDFLAAPKDCYFYRLRHLRADHSMLAARPDWRVARAEQACNAEGDFVYPAEGNGVLNAAWYFGGHAEWGGGWPRREEARSGGFLLTAHGHGVADLSPAMIWSRDGTLLALCRLVDRADLRWRLLLLDQRHGLLRADGALLPPGMPRFLRLDDEGLSLRLDPSTWDTAAPQSLTYTLAQLYAMPVVPMVAGNGLRVEATQADQLRWWEALDTAPLRPYRSPR